jgi:hypothetical protein
MSLTSADEKNFRIFERKVLKKILGPRRTEEGDYRILMNDEIRDLTEGEDIVGFYINRKTAVIWTHTNEGSRAYNNKNHKLEASRGETKRLRCGDQIQEDIRRIGIWRSKIQDRKTWAKVIREAREKGRM